MQVHFSSMDSEQVHSHAEKSFEASFYRKFFHKHENENHKISTSFVGFNLTIFHFNIQGKLYIILCEKLLNYYLICLSDFTVGWCTDILGDLLARCLGVNLLHSSLLQSALQILTINHKLSSEYNFV